MTEYTCSVCNIEFNEEEKSLTNDENKCILHCEKEDWHQIQDTILGKIRICDELRYNAFREYFNKYFNARINSSLIVKGVHFPYNLIISGDALSQAIMSGELKEINIHECVFYGDQNISLNGLPTFELNKMKIFNIQSNYKLSFNSCKIKELTISTSNIANLHIQFSKFENLKISGHFPTVQYRTIKNINLVATEVKNDCCIYELKLDRLRLHSVEFFKTTLEKLYIKEEIELDKSKFDKRLDFFDVEYLGKLNLVKTSISNDTSFLGLNSNSIINVENRETARIIKNSFEQQNNIIEANKYYSLEMKEREKELEQEKKKNPFEWLVFKIHGMTSNHSQDWLLALFWIFYIGFTASILDFYMMQDTELKYIHYNFDKLKITSIIALVTIFTAYTLTYKNKLFHTVIWIGFYLIYTFTFKDMTLNHFANVINPFSIMTKGDTLNLGMLIFKIIIAYLMYQFIVSVRQNTRRK